MVLEIAQLGQPVLREVSQEVPAEAIGTPQLQTLIDEMLGTLAEAEGAGLAAPQVFESRRVFLAAILPRESEDDPAGVEVFINPRIVARSEEKESDWEGCLSFMELQVLVPRHQAIRVEYTGRDGQPRSMEATGRPARIIQHEHDHLDGILTIDRAQSTHHIIKASELDAVRGEHPAK